MAILRQPPRRPPVESPHATLPPPSPDALAHSERLRRVLRDRIAAGGGWLPFDAFMDCALYEPGLGYYAGGSRKFGADGDFVTAPEISDLFGRTLARQIAEILATSGGDILELGPGTGRLAVQVLGELARLDRLPDRYCLLDVSAELRERQRERIAEELPELAHRAVWLDALPETFRGVVLANEVLDAVPVSLVVWRDDGLHERGVGVDGDAFVWIDRPLVDGPVRTLAEALPVDAPYLTEIAPRVTALVATLAARLEHGALLFIDYGFGRGEYYHPQRDRGTLMGHYRHHALDDPFHLPGLQDLTAHVDFTAVAEAGVAAGLRFAGYTTQASFLMNCGLVELLSAVPAAHAHAYLPLVARAQKLMSPSEMGELFKVVALTRGIESPLIGFRRGDLSRLL